MMDPAEYYTYFFRSLRELGVVLLLRLGEKGYLTFRVDPLGINICINEYNKSEGLLPWEKSVLVFVKERKCVTATNSSSILEDVASIAVDAIKEQLILKGILPEKTKVLSLLRFILAIAGLIGYFVVYFVFDLEVLANPLMILLFAFLLFLFLESPKEQYTERAKYEISEYKMLVNNLFDKIEYLGRIEKHDEVVRIIDETIGKSLSYTVAVDIDLAIDFVSKAYNAIKQKKSLGNLIWQPNWLIVDSVKGKLRLISSLRAIIDILITFRDNIHTET